MNRTKSNMFLSALIMLADIGIIAFSFYFLWRFLPKIDYNDYFFYAITFLIVGNCMDFFVITRRKKYDVFLSCLLINGVSAIVTIFASAVINYKNPYIYSFLYIFIFFPLTLFFHMVLQKILSKIVDKTELLVIESTDTDITFAKKIKYSCVALFKSWYTHVDTSDDKKFEEFLNGEFKRYNSIFITKSIPEDKKKRLIVESINAKKDVYILPQLYDINITKYELVQFDDTPAFKIKPFGISKGMRFLKRCMDVFISSIMLLVLSPLMIIVAVLIKLDSRGPVFYTQKRVTENEREFNIYKFRTMIDNAEKESGPIFATENDSRITRVGKILRRTRIDELPQLINILKGDMSLVGPRPERPEFVREFKKTIENYDKRHAVKAGLTGFAQVYSRYDTSAEDKLLYDLIYIREYSFWLDIKIILMTLRTVFTKEASQGFKS